jgi:radical SAM protein with 4Fe4S-binding SPASM domain
MGKHARFPAHDVHSHDTGAWPHLITFVYRHEVKLREARLQLPVVDSLPAGKGRGLPEKRDEQSPVCTLAVWELTLACDHGCLHCGPRAGRARDNELTTEECLKLVDELAELGVGEVTLIGGEAYLRNDFILIMRAIRERGMSCGMTTGGLNLTQERCEAMAEAGISTVSVSIDGLEKSHDHVRAREGSWQRAFQALENLKAAGIKRSANTQINALTHTELPELLELLAPMGIHSWQLQFTVAHGGAGDHPELLVQPYLLPEVFETLSSLADRCRQLRIRPFTGNSVGYFGPHEQKLRGTLRRSGHWEGCEAGRSLIGIESDGGIKACPTLGGPTNIGGSWREHGLRAIWERAPEITYGRERGLDELWGFCRSCYYADTCRAGCTAVTEPLLGRPGNNPLCHHRALELKREGLRERLERVVPPFGAPFDNGLFRVIVEPIDEAEREARGAVEVYEPRTDRLVDRLGAGVPVFAPDPESG